MNSEDRKVFVAFSEKTDLKWLRRFLPRGFRHCSVHINDGVAWMSIEALAGFTEVFVHEVGSDYDLPAHLRRQGMIVIEAKLRRDDKAAKPQLPALYSCVEFTKRVLGLRRPLIVTPSQLYKHLQKASQS